MKTCTATQVIIANMESTDDNKVRWFSDIGCVVKHEESSAVYVGGTLIGSFGRREVGVRNLLLVGLSRDKRIRKGKLAEAFGLGAERLRQISRQVERDGIDALPRRPQGGRVSPVTPQMRRKMEQLFAAGLSARAAYERYGKRAGITSRTARLMRVQWGAQGKAQETPEPQLELELTDEPVEIEEEVVSVHDPEEQAVATGADQLRGGTYIRFAGSWLLLALAHALRLHTVVLSRWRGPASFRERLRVVLDAVIIALGLGQRCVEGVRRLNSDSGGLLLRSGGVPTADRSRKVLHRYVSEAGVMWAHLDMMQCYMQVARRAEKEAAVFYVDNHLRPYTGKHTVRKGWRMQDKQVKPGTTDYYVHDEDGRPVWRFDVPSHDSLTSWLLPVTAVLRGALGEQQRILVAFDRAGAYPEQLASLRDRGLEFVTYERRPYALLSSEAFTETVEVNGERFGLCEEHQRNLGKGRGRVRRLSVRTPQGRQVNLLASSQEPAWRLIEVMQGRWVQENGFKHGNERWGINQLDGRKVEPYAPGTVIPNPGRRRLDHALRLARRREGEALRLLSRLPASDPKRVRCERDLATAREDQERLESQRPQVPKRAPVEETELRGKLVHHQGGLKMLMDTIRIACANAESELSAALGSFMHRPQEAKKVLANVFAAPGAVRINRKSITVTLSPVGTRGEQRAIASLLEQVNRARYTLPGDPERRILRFRSQFS